MLVKNIDDEYHACFQAVFIHYAYDPLYTLVMSLNVWVGIII